MHLPCLIGPRGLVSGVPSVGTSLAKTDGLTGYPTYRVLSGLVTNLAAAERAILLSGWPNQVDHVKPGNGSDDPGWSSRLSLPITGLEVHRIARCYRLCLWPACK